MTNTEIMLLIMLLFFMLLVGFSIPVLLQIRRTARGMAETLQHLNQGLPLIMKNLMEITTDINRTTAMLHRQVAELSITLNRVQGIAGVLIGVEEVLRRQLSFPFLRIFKNALAIARGIKVFIENMKEGLPQEKEEKTR